ncbi:putative neuraminidase [Sphaerotilus hippei]|uniref:Putative neuraminidase n=1 Tax=Sphaerotilus hippei TaxID=744406 RepID=A0A318H6J7_9BURK|nr:exo-alpha-sialidase [Sphaerotilus hippei]PXW99341.1 putative neuraminidase [Sphaerotilus hippei]
MTRIAQGLHPDLRPGQTVLDLPASGVQSHAANLATLPDGSLACVWFGGTQEGLSDICVWFSRLPAGTSTWTAPVRLSHDDGRSEQNPILFNAPDGRLWLLHTAQRAGHQDTAVVRCRTSTDGGLSWDAPRDLLPGSGLFVRQPPVVRRDGAWLLPVFRCRALPGLRWSGDDDDSIVYLSHDQGRSWQTREVPGSSGCVHMNIVPGSAGPDHLLAFYRSRWADRVHRNESTDGGETWSAPQPTPVPNNNSSIQVIRLASGRLAMVCNPVGAEHAQERRVSLYDEIESEDDAAAPLPEASASTADGRRLAFWGTPRAPMALMMSDDDGRSWPMRRDLECGDGYCMSNNSAEQRNRELSYPSIHQSADGQLQVAYTRHRQHIRHVRCDEAWVATLPADAHLPTPLTD